METVGNRWGRRRREDSFVGGGDINAMIRFVITSIRDMACG